MYTTRAEQAALITSVGSEMERYCGSSYCRSRQKAVRNQMHTEADLRVTTTACVAWVQGGTWSR